MNQSNEELKELPMKIIDAFTLFFFFFTLAVVSKYFFLGGEQYMNYVIELGIVFQFLVLVFFKWRISKKAKLEAKE